MHMLSAAVFWLCMLNSAHQLHRPWEKVLRLCLQLPEQMQLDLCHLIVICCLALSMN
jgi:hypothetical protein